MTTSDDFIQYAFLPTENGLTLLELNAKLSTFKKIIFDKDIMEAKTRPQYYEFLKEWSAKNKITSFFGSDKPEFLQAWNNVKNGGQKKPERVVAAPVVAQAKKVDAPVVAQAKKVDAPVVTAPVVSQVKKVKATNILIKDDSKGFDDKDLKTFGNPTDKSQAWYDILEVNLVEYYEPGLKRINALVDMINKNNKKNPAEVGVNTKDYYMDFNVTPISNGNRTFVLKQQADYTRIIRALKKRIEALE